MINAIILIYSILVCLCFFLKIKKNAKLVVQNNGQLIIEVIKILLFFIFFILGLRILNLFRLNKVLDLNNINFNINYLLIFILLLILRKLVFFLFKNSFFKFHYVMMSEVNFSVKINTIYKAFYYNLIYMPAYYLFKYIIYLNYAMIFLLFIFLIKDLFFNNLILSSSLLFLKYYSLFKIIYFGYKFMITKQNLILDYYTYNLIYPGDYEKNFFINFDDIKHKRLIDESIKYSAGVILERFVYNSIDLGNIAEMPYFNSLKR